MNDFEDTTSSSIILAILRLAVAVEEGAKKIANSLEKIEDGNCCSSEDLNEILDRGFSRINDRLNVANMMHERVADIQKSAYLLAEEINGRF